MINHEVLWSGNDLFSQDPAVQVSSALERFTSLFGMGKGGSAPLESPEQDYSIKISKATRY